MSEKKPENRTARKRLLVLVDENGNARAIIRRQTADGEVSYRNVAADVVCPQKVSSAWWVIGAAILVWTLKSAADYGLCQCLDWLAALAS